MTTAITEYSKTEAALSELTTQYKGIVYDVTTREGMEAAKKGRGELRCLRVDLEKMRVEIKAPALERCRLIDAEAKRISSTLSSLEDPIDEQIKKEESRKEEEAKAKAIAETRRVEAIKARIEAIKGIALAMTGKPSKLVAEAIATLEAAEIGSVEFMELTADAKTAKDATLFALGKLKDAAAEYEAEQARVQIERAELAKLRAEQEQRDRERAEEDRAARAKIEAEQRESRQRIEEEEKQARLAREAADREAKAIRDAEEAKLRAERQRIEAERQAQEAVKREAERKANEVLDAKTMLDTFVQRFGHLEEFAPVVSAISAMQTRKAA